MAYTNRKFSGRKSQTRKSLGSFRNRKSANFLGVQVLKLQIRYILWLIRK